MQLMLLYNKLILHLIPYSYKYIISKLFYAEKIDAYGGNDKNYTKNLNQNYISGYLTCKLQLNFNQKNCLILSNKEIMKH